MKKRLILINEETLEELFSFKLSLLNVFVAGVSSAILLVIATIFFIAFTPLRQYIPGYSSSSLRKETAILVLKTDSLSQALEKNEAYFKGIQKVLTGNLDYATFSKDSILATPTTMISPEKLQASDAELDLRKEVEQEEKKNKPNVLTKKKLSKSIQSKS